MCTPLGTPECFDTKFSTAVDDTMDDTTAVHVDLGPKRTTERGDAHTCSRTLVPEKGLFLKSLLCRRCTRVCMVVHTQLYGRY